jgi:hypothetical protein
MMFASASIPSAVEHTTNCAKHHRVCSSSGIDCKLANHDMSKQDGFDGNSLSTVSELVKRKRGRPKKIISPASTVESMHQSSILAKTSENLMYDALRCSDTKLFQTSSFEKYSNINNDAKSPNTVNGEPLITLKFRNASLGQFDSIRRKVGRPKKKRCHEKHNTCLNQSKLEESSDNSESYTNQSSTKSRNSFTKLALKKQKSKRSYLLSKLSEHNTNRLEAEAVCRIVAKKVRNHAQSKSSKKTKHKSSRGNTLYS